MTLAQFLLYWHTFVLTHVCQVWRPDTVGLGNHVVYGGSCAEAIPYAQHLHGIVAWMGSSQGLVNFGPASNL